MTNSKKENRISCRPTTTGRVTSTGTQVCVACGGLYSVEQLEGIPEEVIKVAAGSGNPTALINLERGQIVLDIGSGGGIDCFLAARKVGPEGKVIGVDKSAEKIRIAKIALRKWDLKNVEFRVGDMEKLSVNDESVDVVMSNCVISISKRKEQVFREAFRILKSGGKLVVSDWTAPHSEKQYTNIIRHAGFRDVQVLERRYINENANAIDVIANKP